MVGQWAKWSGDAVKGFDNPEPTGSSATKLSWFEERRVVFIDSQCPVTGCGQLPGRQGGGMTWTWWLFLMRASSRERLS